ncbi:thioredoxin family protein [Atopobacter sp. AH10]|uniref:thioredoxin family protein n=1 Tax=Atopobacter sp. AH10 TaxID=2315861 RepID=UPI001314343B|nr:thioredoxin family protein [Atopobacter sp. AH10]
MIKEIKQEEFKEAIAEGFVLLDVYGPHCGPCRMLDKTLHILEREYPDMTILKLDSSLNEQFCEENHIVGVPTLFFFFNGELKERLTGALSEDELMEIAGPYLYA